MKRLVLALAVTAAAAAIAKARAQEPPVPPAPSPAPVTQVAPPAQPADLRLVLTAEGGRRIGIAVPPALTDPASPADPATADAFSQALAGDLGYSPWFVVADPTLYPKGFRPPVTREDGDAWIATGAQFLLDTQIKAEGGQTSFVAQLYDLRTLKAILARKYLSAGATSRRVGHAVANDVVRQFTGKPGPFLTKIAFVSSRDGGRNKELYLMDYDGANQRRITYHRSLSLSPDWSFDGEKIVYQSYINGQPGLFWFGKEGGTKTQIPLPTALNASPSFSPDGKTVAFCGSVKGNPEIFTVNLDGTGLKRLTNNVSIDSTPRFSPNGREIAFTSNRQGSPQIYLMDTEGANVRRLTLTGNWSDEAAFSPDGSKIAFACRNEGDFQICILDMQSGRTFQITTGAGANENPTWSPDGTLIAWEHSNGGASQIVSAFADGSNLRTLTSAKDNSYPAWARNLE